MFKTLLVEDNLIYRSILKGALLKRFRDMEIKESSGDGDALDIVNTFCPDMIIMDICLNSDVTGLDLTKIIKTERPEIVIVILSQQDNPEYRAVAQNNGANFFLSKSCSLENFFDCIGPVCMHHTHATF